MLLPLDDEFRCARPNGRRRGFVNQVTLNCFDGRAPVSALHLAPLFTTRPKRFSQWCQASGFEYLCSWSLGLDEFEELGIDDVGLRGDHAVRVVLVCLQGGIVEELG